MRYELLQKAVESLVALFGDRTIPDGFRYNGQTFAERAEGWLLHAAERLQEELESGDEAEG